MRIPSKDIPQADVLDDVVKAVESVGGGAHTFEEIAEALGKVDRQGRYYRRAGEILGLLQNEYGRNHSLLTELGRRFIEAPYERDRILAQAVLGSRIFQRIIPFIEASGTVGVTRSALREFIEGTTERVGTSMIPRRVNTIVGWLERIGVLAEDGDKYRLTRKLPNGVPIIEYADPDEPLFSIRHDLKEYTDVATRVNHAKGYIEAQIDAAARERANGSHRMLTNAVAARVREAGGIPKQNRYVDLSANVSGAAYLFEMKSTTETNVQSQVRRAISQLYEYRYIQQIPEAKLVVVVENPLPADKTWMIDYLVNDRGLGLVWDGDGRHLHCPDALKPEFSFLVS